MNSPPDKISPHTPLPVRLQWRETQGTPSGVALDSAAFQFGLGVMAKVRVDRRLRGELSVFRLWDHVQRACEAARLLQCGAPSSVADLSDACLALLRQHHAQPGLLGFVLHAAEPPGTNLGVFFGRLELGATWWALPAGARVTGEPTAVEGVHLAWSSWLRPHTASQVGPSNALGQRTTLWAAERAARLSGFDGALQLDAAGHVIGAPFANVFAVFGHRVITPPLAGGAFAGITRATLLTLAEESGYFALEAPLTRNQLLQADEVFLASTEHELQPVRAIEHVAIGARSPGPVTARLSERYLDTVAGADTNHPEWLSVL